VLNISAIFINDTIFLFETNAKFHGHGKKLFIRLCQVSLKILRTCIYCWL